MPQFLTTSGTSHLIEEVIIKAKTDLVLITPYLKLSRILFERLTEANQRGVRIRLVYGKSELHPNEQKQLDALTNIELFFLQNLHAKCYYNEKVLVVSSMNLYEFSEKNNREMGILLTQRDDEECFADALAEAHSILAAAKVVSTRTKDATTTSKEVVSQRTPVVPPAEKEDSAPTGAPDEEQEYDPALAVQKLYEMLRRLPEFGERLTIETKSRSHGKFKTFSTIFGEGIPREGIHFEFTTDVRFSFDESADYRVVRDSQRDQINGHLDAYRCYWNWNKIQIYAAKKYDPINEDAEAEYFYRAITSTTDILKSAPASPAAKS